MAITQKNAGNAQNAQPADQQAKLDRFKRGLESGDLATRRSAASVLNRMSGQLDIRPILRNLEAGLWDKDFEVRKNSAEALVKYGQMHGADLTTGWGRLADVHAEKTPENGPSFVDMRRVAPWKPPPGIAALLTGRCGLYAVCVAGAFTALMIFSSWNRSDATLSKQAMQPASVAAPAQAYLSAPAYLSSAGTGTNRHYGTEYNVFYAIYTTCKDNPAFVSEFNRLNDDEKRGFILFVRAKALSSFIGDTKRFKREHWTAADNENVLRLALGYIGSAAHMEASLMEYSSVCRKAEKQREEFFALNGWLNTYLGGAELRDLRTGLLYFLMEHEVDDFEMTRKARLFFNLRDRMADVARGISLDKANNTRISPKKGISDSQIREIVCAAYVGELFYGIDAKFSLVIFAQESNFDRNERTDHGEGIGQITALASPLALQSGQQRAEMERYAGARIARKLTSRLTLNDLLSSDVFEAMQTIGLKAADLEAYTSQIGYGKKVMLPDGRKVPLEWGIAYMYNGSPHHARAYANSVYRVYTGSRDYGSSWPGAFEGS